ncbi:MAG TPA: hypothetical protein VEH27_03425 [Methylomirabilota bacterium]|nr:hypothetical protein [Methylomirabilota bacterium]
MKILLRKNARSDHGFTMVEVALAMGVVVIAMVAILGILPAGMETQKENRDTSLVGDDAAIFMNAIRTGARGMDYLTNHVEEVFLVQKQVDRTGRLVSQLKKVSIGTRFRSGEEVVGSLMAPAIRRPILPYSQPSPYFRTNVQAIVRSINRSTVDRRDANDPNIFRYRLTTELNPAQPLPNPYDSKASDTNIANLHTNEMLFAANSVANLHELRLTIEWPVYQVNNEWRVGRNRKTYRTLLNGNVTNIAGYYFFEPNSYTNAALALLPQQFR